MNAPVRTLILGSLLLAGVASAKTTVTFWHTYNTDSTENKILTSKIIPDFEKKNPDIDVVAQQIPYTEFRQKMLTSVAGETGPDLARIDIIWTPEFAQLGALEKVDDMPGFKGLKSQVFPGPLSTNVYDGGYYGVPLDTNTQVLIWNPEMLKAAGISKPPTTMAQFKTTLEKLQKKDGNKITQYGFAVPGPYNWFLLPWIWSNGGEITDPKVTKATGYLNSPKTVAAVQTLVDWYKAGLISPSIAGSGLGSWEGMGAGKYAGSQDGPWAFPSLQAQYPKLSVTHSPFPSGAGGSVSVVGGENIVLFKSSKNKAAAWKFLRYLLSKDAQITMATTGQIPVLKSLVNDPYIKGHPYYGVYLKQLSKAKARPPHPAYTKMEDLIQGQFQEIFSGKKTVQAALDEAAQKVDAVLK
ncbi:extracellular solute-binding protein [Deinococcus roseus]|uniref:ABC transporter substrate-binding protein n=1 Tax=Deinococcus roseus TaxID=392414 RepID=A0ABQ2D622_9DEIO|nr:extracellular solute-binding protein [Deinococcus roseus]GGJ47371.1 ABC transporter substrate-binding protein [Deinococcus roseus]